MGEEGVGPGEAQRAPLGVSLAFCRKVQVPPPRWEAGLEGGVCRDGGDLEQPA